MISSLEQAQSQISGCAIEYGENQEERCEHFLPHSTIY